MKSIKNILILLSFQGLVFATPSLRYESIEHLLLGSSVTLKYLDNNGNTIIELNGGKPIKIVNTENGNIELSFPEIVYLAGDLIAAPKINISSDIDINDKDRYNKYEMNFKQNFNMFDKKYKGNYSGAKEYLIGSFIPKIREIIFQELKENQKAIAEGKSIQTHSDLKLNCATGGGCSNQSDLINKKGLYMDATIKGGDHFGQNAINNYITGHTLALKTALNAKSNDELKLAYAYEGYAQHFLTDIFASGHIRTPINALINLKNEIELNEIDSLLKLANLSARDIFLSFAKTMHDEDNENGLWIRSQFKTTPWKAYGDHYLFIKDNNENLMYLKETMQFAIDQIFEAYKSKSFITNQITYITEKVTLIEARLPDLEFSKTTNLNQSPRYSIINGYLYERGYRDWPNGSAGSLCALNRSIEDLIEDKNIKNKIKWTLSQYCYTTIEGFAKTWDYNNKTPELTISSEDDFPKTGTLYTHLVDNKHNVTANFNHINVKNKQEFYVHPKLTDINGNSCSFLFPIKIKRYGTYTSLDEMNGNSIKHRGVSIGHEYINCTNKKTIVYYQASAINKDNYFGLYNGSTSVNVELCNDKGTLYLSNINNHCKNWQ